MFIYIYIYIYETYTDMHCRGATHLRFYIHVGYNGHYMNNEE